MKIIDVSILVPREALLASILDPRQMFVSVNDFLKQAGKPAMFNVQLVGLTKNVKLFNDQFTVHTDSVLEEVKKTDLIFVPALRGDMQTALKMNQDFISWIVKQYEAGASAASLCVGAFLLAATGLLNGKKCSTHWTSAKEFQEMFPDVTLIDDKIISEENGLYSSGGANSYWNLLLHLVEKYTDRETAILASKFFAIDFGRQTQLEFNLFQGQKGHEDDAVRKAQDFIEIHFKEKFTVDQLSSRFGVGRRSFERRFKKATRTTVIEYIQHIKVEAAKKNFESGRKTINEVMYDVGYSDTKAFRGVFKKITGMSPIEYRSKYNKETLG